MGLWNEERRKLFQTEGPLRIWIFFIICSWVNKSVVNLSFFNFNFREKGSFVACTEPLIIFQPLCQSLSCSSSLWQSNRGLSHFVAKINLWLNSSLSYRWLSLAHLSPWPINLKHISYFSEKPLCLTNNFLSFSTINASFGHYVVTFQASILGLSFSQ